MRKIWNGLDSGGTEQLWEPDVILDMLHVVKQHEPFSYNDPNSPIFEDLEELYPDITWRNYNADGSFRPIFRKVNTLRKLGLTSPEPFDAIVTEFGNSLLIGEISIADVYKLAASAHQEKSGEFSMSIMSHALLNAPREIFSVAEIELGIAQQYQPSESSIKEILDYVRNNDLIVSSPTRVRRIRNFMNTLVYAEVAISTNNGWKLNNPTIAKEVASSIEIATIASASVEGDIRNVKTHRKEQFTSISKTKASAKPFFEATKKSIDNEQRSLLLERASQSHEDTVYELAMALMQVGVKPIEDRNSFDVALLEPYPALFEIKSINNKNIISQLRKALIQLIEYRWRHANVFGKNPKLFVVLDGDPSAFLNREYFEFCLEIIGEEIIWLQEGQFVDRFGHKLLEHPILQQ